MATLTGTLQFAPAGAPVQLSEAVPLIPAPPMESEYLAIVPAVTVRNFEPPGATSRPRPRETPVPVSETVCGLLGALSVTVSAPLSVPAAVGVKVNRIWHVPNPGSAAPQLLLCEKLPLA